MKDKNDTLYLTDETNLNDYVITIPEGFYLPSELVTALNTAISVVIVTNPPTFSYNASAMTYSFNVPVGATEDYAIYPYPETSTVPIFAGWSAGTTYGPQSYVSVGPGFGGQSYKSLITNKGCPPYTPLSPNPVPNGPPPTVFPTSTITTTIWEVIPDLTLFRFTNNPSLFKTLGFTLAYQGVTVAADEKITSNPTLSSYTDYIEILSNKIMTYTDVWDGQSGNGGSNAIMRIQATDETSMNTLVDANENPLPITCRPFVIYRQFKMPKAIKWNPDSTIDWFDIKVVDQYGEIVPLPVPDPLVQANAVANGLVYNPAYPDFQITLLASED
jgi:hypothetical protein